MQNLTLIPDNGGRLTHYNFALNGEVFITSDWHLGHRNIIKHVNRPYLNVDEMDADIIRKLNDRVGPDDMLIHLGDFVWAYKDDAMWEYEQRIQHYIDQLACKRLVLVWGNHDKKMRESKKLKEWFQFCTPRLELRHGEQIYICDHYPMDSWDRSFHGSRHLYGHVHGTATDSKLSGSNPTLLRLDVGVDAHDFWPIPLDTIESLLALKVERHSRLYQPRERRE